MCNIFIFKKVLLFDKGFINVIYLNVKYVVNDFKKISIMIII